MSKKEYYESAAERKIMINKIMKLDKAKATLLHDAASEDKPPQNILSKGCRGLTFMEIPLSCLEYVWIGSTKAKLKDRLLAKAAYQIRINEDTNPRKHLLFDLEENMYVVKEDEVVMLKEFYGVDPVTPTTVTTAVTTTTTTTADTPIGSDIKSWS